ncbi:MAG: hypothetical protein G01um101429_214 [Parcubacteria group bacterium Gr01-1014_29]|nr:MAG: hypothetical protein G01um101429_214 [Parcubacteria group bacterium Gr01-1014_29]
MSGGVDSSVAAALLKKTGYDVSGVFMREWVPKGMECSEPKNRQMAARAASHLGIPFAVWDFRAVYETNVASYLIREYAAGRTPNPDIMCNKDIKFGVFLDAARRAGAHYISTGHYVRLQATPTLLVGAPTKSVGAGHYIRREPEFQISNFKFLKIENYKLKIALDINKDQSYFLWTLTQRQLQHCIFPIGGYTKLHVRQLAKKFGLPNWDRKDSQGVCFVGELNFGKFLRAQLPVREGVVVATDGTAVGTHDGTEFYTIGQRIGIKNYESGIMGKREPVYVADKNLETNTLVVASDDSPELFKSECAVFDVSWISGEQPKLPLQCLGRIRYRQPLQSCRIEAQNYADSMEDSAEFFSAKVRVTSASIRVRFAQPQRAVTPGQSAVFYSKAGEVLGGGIIE